MIGSRATAGMSESDKGHYARCGWRGNSLVGWPCRCAGTVTDNVLQPNKFSEDTTLRCDARQCLYLPVSRTWRGQRISTCACQGFSAQFRGFERSARERLSLLKVAINHGLNGHLKPLCRFRLWRENGEGSGLEAPMETAAFRPTVYPSPRQKRNLHKGFRCTFKT